MVQWVRLWTSNARDMCSIPGQGAKVSHARQCGQKTPQNSKRAWACVHVKCLVTSVVSNSFATSWTVTHEAPLFVGFSRQEYQSGLPFPFPGDLPNSGIEPTSPESPVLQEDSLPLSHRESPEEGTILSHSQSAWIKPASPRSGLTKALSLEIQGWTRHKHRISLK